MAQTTVSKIPAAFYRGYELGNGLNDWIARPMGASPAVPKSTLFGNKATIQIIGANTYWEIAVDAFRFGADSTPKQLHEWWRLFIDNVFITDPSLFTVKIAELVFIEDRQLDADGGDDLTALLTTTPVTIGATTFDITGANLLLVENDLLFIHDQGETGRGSDVLRVTANPIGNIVLFENIRVGSSGTTSAYTAGTRTIYKAEAAWRDVFLQPPPDIGPAEDASLGHFRKSIPFAFITNSDPFPVLPR